jgi:hypothetical protein|tara:strand:+ start:201 stop:2276 length:2076 start_codon:yes stop_codon:yes gene_type:complete
MRFLKFLKESIIDIPRRTYAPAVFDEADTDNPKIKPSVKRQIDIQLKEFEQDYPIIKTGLIGSILTKKYRNDADLDINILFDVPADKQDEERTRLSKKYLSVSNPDNIQGKLIPGTKHPINFYFITDKVSYDDQEKKADAVFDMETNKFIKRPEDFKFDMNLYLKGFQKKVQQFDMEKGELKRDIIDYDELKELKPNEILNLQDKINSKLEEIEGDLERIKDIGDVVDVERRSAFDKDMTPDEIKTFGIKNRLPKNVVYKLLEKYHYLKFYKKCKAILDDGEVTDAEIKSLKNEAVGKSIAFAFGRFNPPTSGHEKLINKIKSVANGDYKVYLSRSEDNKKNPLSPKKKLEYMKKMFPQHARNIEINQTNMVLDIATLLYKKGYTDLKMVAGSDRVREFDTMLKKYNGVQSRHGKYDFNSIEVVSAGERDPDAEGATGMSASKMRDAVAKNDINSFKRGLPSGFNGVQGLFNDIRKGMNLTLEHNERKIPSLVEFEQQQIRDLYIRDMIFNIGDKVNYVTEDIEGKVVRRGTNYIVLENNNNLTKAWIWNCVPVSSDKEVALREFNLNVDYGFKAVSEVKEPEVKKKLTDSLKKKAFGALRRELNMKQDENESYEIGADYANHTKEVTPGQKADAKPVDAKDRGKPTDSVNKEDIKEWANEASTIDKYKQRYNEEWRKRLEEVVKKMMENL